MTFQEADILLTICMQCDVDDVKSAKAHLNGPVNPSWEEVTNFINDLPNYSLLCKYWSVPFNEYNIQEIRELIERFPQVDVIGLEKIINQVSM